MRICGRADRREEAGMMSLVVNELAQIWRDIETLRKAHSKVLDQPLPETETEFDYRRKLLARIQIEESALQTRLRDIILNG